MARKMKKLRKQSSAPRVPGRRDHLNVTIEEFAHSLGIKIDKSWMPAIRANLQVTLRHGALVTAFELEDEAEPAPVFEP